MENLNEHEEEYIDENVKKKKIPPKCYMKSLVGTIGEPPYSHGNYFTFSEPQVRCLNMWHENMVHLAKKDVIDDIEVEIYEDGDKAWAVVVDDRVPDEYIENEPCYTGYDAPPKRIRKIMNERYGWETSM